MKKIILQGAMDIETDIFIRKVQEMPQYEKIEEGGLEFHVGTEKDRQFIVSVTGMGTVQAAMATAVAIERFRPDAVISQGTAGAQLRDLSVGDVVLVEEAVNINALSMPKKQEGEGSDPFSWEGFHTEYYPADPALLERISSLEYPYGDARRGKTATGDLFSREADRILWLAEKFHTCCEEMETAAVFQICRAFGIPCAALRVISNNELLGDAFDEQTAARLQEHIWELARGYL